MKNKMMTLAAAGALVVASLAYGFAPSKSCPLEGTPDCPKITCPLVGTPDCPYDNAKVAKQQACCLKK